MFVDQVARSLKTISCLLLTPSAKSCDLACFLTVNFRWRGTCLHSVDTQPLFWPNYQCPLGLSNDQVFTSLRFSVASKVSLLWENLIRFHIKNKPIPDVKHLIWVILVRVKYVPRNPFRAPSKPMSSRPSSNIRTYILISFFRRFIVDDGRNYIKRYAFSYKNLLMWIKPQIVKLGNPKNDHWIQIVQINWNSVDEAFKLLFSTFNYLRFKMQHAVLKSKCA